MTLPSSSLIRMRAGSIDSSVPSQTSMVGSPGSASLRTVSRIAGTRPRGVSTGSAPAATNDALSISFIEASGIVKRRPRSSNPGSARASRPTW